MWKMLCLLLLVSVISACAYQPGAGKNPDLEYHTVQAGESMDSIAVAFKVTPVLLKRANPWLNPVNIKPGMRLLIPSQRYTYTRAPARNKTTVTTARAYRERKNGQVATHNLHAGHIWPLRTIDVSSHYGYRHGRLHKGIDLRAPHGTPISASADGVVVFSGRKNGYGNIVVIDHGKGVQTAYAHNSHNRVRKNQRVMQGEVIAEVGRTGKATGNHVHYEFRRHGRAVNPAHHIHAAL